MRQPPKGSKYPPPNLFERKTIMAKARISLGDVVKDTITGFQGIAVARTV